jgi:small-conductance mechanosensitive channel
VSFETAKPWRFTAIEPIASSETETPALKKLLAALQIAAAVWGKTYHASKALATAGIAFLLFLFAAAIWFTRRHWDTPLSTTLGHSLAWIAIAAATLAAIRLLLTKVLRYRNPLIQVLASIFMCVAGWLILLVHLRVAEPRYLRIGPKYRS